MKKLLLCILLSISLIGCYTTSGKQVLPQDLYGGAMRNVFEAVYSQAQFDSICVADTLPNNFSKWHKTTFVDDETSANIVEYLYIKKLGEKQSIYRVEVRDNQYKIAKRITDR